MKNVIKHEVSGQCKPGRKKCRINRGKIALGTVKKMSDHPCCRINRGKMSD